MSSCNAVAGIALFATTLLAPLEALAQETPPPAQRPPSVAQKIDGEDRLFIRFVQDAAIVPSYWLEGQVRFQTNQAAFDPDVAEAGESDTLSVGPIFALNVAEDLEFGARVALARRDPSNGGSDTGLTDLDLWGKVSVVSDPVKISLGLLLSAPTGSKDKFLGTGETNVEFFGGVRRDFAHVTFAGNLGLRINQDPDFEDLELEGKNSVLFGAAALFPAGDRMVLSAEWAVETERFEGLKNDSRLLGGLEYRYDESILFRGALGGGLSDGAPDFELIGSAVWLF